MAQKHANAGERIDVRPYGAALTQHPTATLAKTNLLEIIRLSLPAGKEIPTHKVDGPIVVQCLEGKVEFTADGQLIALESGELLHLAPASPHAVKALENASVLVTIFFGK
ncbi:MAG: cupin domain-containing protein [Planctomycetota bacterium]